MSKIRVFDLAKDFGVDSKELACFLKEKMGLSVHHLTMLDELTVKRLRKIWPHGICEKGLAEVNRTLPFEQPRIYQDENGWWRIEGNGNRFQTQAEAQKTLEVIDRYQEKTAQDIQIRGTTMKPSPEKPKDTGSQPKTSPQMMELLKERLRVRKRIAEADEAQGTPSSTSMEPKLAPPNIPSEKDPQYIRTEADKPERQALKEELNDLNAQSEPKTQTSSDNNFASKLQQIFKYLLELKTLAIPPKRDLKDYGEKLWWQAELPLSPYGCFLRGEGRLENKDAWLEARKQQIPSYPEPPSILAEWIAIDGRDPSKPPSRKNSISGLTTEEQQELEALPEEIESIELEERHRKNAKAPDLSAITQIKGTLEQKFLRWQELEAKKEIRFDEFSDRIAAWETWRSKKWETWAAEALPKTRIQRLYGEFFAAYQRFQKEGEDIELIWGHGLLLWSTGNFYIRRPVLTTRMELNFDAERGIFSVVPSEGVTRLETDMLAQIELPNPASWSDLELEAQEIDPWIVDQSADNNEDKVKGVTEFLQKYKHLIHPHGGLDYERPCANPTERPKHPLILNAPVLFIRRGRGRLWEQEFKSIIATLEKGYDIPPTLRPLVEEESPIVDEETLRQWRPVGEDLLFPLPYNEEQKEIVRRLAVHNGVVVQGPPGTGKSHTIVNLICHLLSHGKRVLVTSQGERALRVLGEMISKRLKEIKPLCVSVLGSDKDSADELEQAVTQISEKLSSLDKVTLQREIHSLNQRLSSIREGIARKKNQIKHMAEREQETFEIAGRDLTPLGVSRWLEEHHEHGWLPDRLSTDCQPPLLDEETARLFYLQGSLRREDLKQLALTRPSLELLPTPLGFENLINALADAERELTLLQEEESAWVEIRKELALKRPDSAKLPVLDELGSHFLQLTKLQEQIEVLQTLPETFKELSLDRSRANDLLEITGKSIEILRRVSESWMQIVVTDVFAGETQKQYWHRFYSDCSDRLQAIFDLEHQLSEHDIILPEAINLTKIKGYLHRCQNNYFGSNFTKRFLYKIFSGKQLKIIQQITVDGNNPCNGDDIILLIEYIESQESLNRLITKWNNVIGSNTGELTSYQHPRLSSWFRSNLDWIKVILDWTEDVSDSLHLILGSAGALTYENYVKLEWWEALQKLAQGHTAKFDQEDLEKDYIDLFNYLEVGANEALKSPLELAEDLRTLDDMIKDRYPDEGGYTSIERHEVELKTRGPITMYNYSLAVCKNCGAKNNITLEGVKREVIWRCGKCKEVLEIYHYLWRKFYKYYKERNLESWRVCLEELINLEKKQIEFDRFEIQKRTAQERLTEVQTQYSNLDSLEKEETELFFDKSYRNILRSIRNKDCESYQSAYAEVHRLAQLEPLAQELNQLSEKLAKVAPRWASNIAQTGGEGILLEPPADWQPAWTWKRAEGWLVQLEQEIKPEELQKEIEILQNQENRLIVELVAQNTWLRQINRIKENQRRSLTAWLQMNKKMGKRTGKYVPHWRLQARKEMAVCQEAIPVWIMPLYRLIENLQVPEAHFDVVIVDESSQCDLFSLSALFRAEKVVIVGDDKQISPTSWTIGSDVIQIQERFLHDIPQKALFEPRTSLYDMARLIFPGQLMLKEHFRCVPEIIQFSNYQFYGGEIIPLRMPQESERLDPPVISVPVPEGYLAESTAKINEPEAKALVDKLVELCANPQYAGKTMGVISLLGEDQTQLIEQMIRDKLDEREIINRRIICGNAYAFQGDERHVIFLSLVAATNQKFRAMVQTGDRQRFNVAASRARDQMWLFHSIDLNDINNPECMRFQLLNHCLQPHVPVPTEAEVESLFESQFERDIYRLIKAHGYSVRPQVKVGHHRIDLVVYGIKDRLAVECDGDKWHGLDKWEADRERESVLVRAGWTFWRIRGSAFYRERVASMNPLWEKLSEMGIKPKRAT